MRRDHAFFQILLQVTAGVALLTLLSSFTYVNEFNEPALWSFGFAGTISWVAFVAAAIAVYITCYPEASTIGHFISSTIVASLVFAWISYDADLLTHRMAPDDYMYGVISFYTDLFFVCICCGVMSCLASSGTTHHA